MQKVVDVQKLQFAEEVPEDFDSTGFSYDYDADGKITAESLAKAKAAAQAAAEEVYDGIDDIVRLPEPLRREFMVVAPHQPKAKRMLITFVPKGAAKVHQHRNCVKLDPGGGVPPALLSLKKVVRIEKVPAAGGGLPALGLEESGVGMYRFTPVDVPPGAEGSTIDLWFTEMQKDWEAPTEFAAVRTTTRRAGGAAALLKLKQSKRLSTAEASSPEASPARPAASGPKYSAAPTPSNPAEYNVMFPAPPEPVNEPDAGVYENNEKAVAAAVAEESGGFDRLASKRPQGAAPIKLLNVTDSMTVATMAHPTSVARPAAEALLEAERNKIGKGASGLFLLRLSAKTAGALVISMYYRNKFHHYNFTRSGDGNYVNNKGRVLGTLPELLRQYQNDPGGLPCVLGQFLAPNDDDDEVDF